MQHLPSYLGFAYLGRGISLQDCSSKTQPLLLTLDEGYLLTAAVPDLQCGIAPLGPPVPSWQPLLGLLLLASGVSGSSQLPPLAWGSGWLLKVTAPGLWREVASPGLPLSRTLGVSSWPPLTSDSGYLLSAAAPDLVYPGLNSVDFCNLNNLNQAYNIIEYL